MSNAASSPTPDASATVKGKNKLTGDLGGTADSPTVVAITSGSASNLNSGTLPAGRLPALTGDVTSSAGSAATTLAAGSATNLNSGTLAAARLPAFTGGDVTSSAGSASLAIGAGKVTNAMLDTTAGAPGGAWASWTPTLTNLTLGNGSKTSKYMQIGKTVFFRFTFVLGSTSSVGSSPSFSLPVTSVTPTVTNMQIGMARLGGTTGTSPGMLLWGSTTSCGIVTYDANSTFSRETAITSANPFTWATNDAIAGHGMYEAA